MKLVKALLRKVARGFGLLEGFLNDSNYSSAEIPRPKKFTHTSKLSYISSLYDKEGMQILEIGSSDSYRPNWLRPFLNNANYIGFDIRQGANVDVVGDAHQLSSYFNPDTFDCIVSCATFEHLRCPWLVAEEISKVLKPNGIVCIETHFSYNAHERPWNYFQFSDEALKVLFNLDLGFEVIDYGLDLPLRARFSSDCPEYLRFKEVGNMFTHSYLVARKIRNFKPEFNWRDYAFQLSSTYKHLPTCK